MGMTGFEQAQLLWRARDEMVAAADCAMSAQSTLRAVVGDLGWRSSAGEAFAAAADDLAGQMGFVAGDFSDDADVLLARGNQAVTS
ncbi:hypothetical protein [Microbacterium sp. G2-8]|uniref:hypothetical protein n=1 Tax=Microbacterium sp. G2-8 TaxID=2842454 RepID=UPI001C891ED3|nr:hypothetical protein [Microbacterium sp. G2-8]